MKNSKDENREYPGHYTDLDGWTPGDLDYFTIDQDWQNYTDEEHKLWAHLYDRQEDVLKGRAISQFMDSLSTLGITRDRIPKLEEVNEILMKKTGWEVVGVPGVIPVYPFTELLANRKFPAGTFLRKPKHMDYIEEPDIFHDLFGHVPLLADPTFADYIQEFGKGSVKARGMNADKFLGRLYWYTVEFGLIEESDGLKIYGAGIMSSPTEAVFALENPSPHRIRFDKERMMRTQVKIDDFQAQYFAIESFDQLFKETAEPDFTPIYEKIKEQPMIKEGETVPEDDFINKGTREYEKVANEKRAAKKKNKS